MAMEATAPTHRSENDLCYAKAGQEEPAKNYLPLLSSIPNYSWPLRGSNTLQRLVGHRSPHPQSSMWSSVLSSPQHIRANQERLSYLQNYQLLLDSARRPLANMLHKWQNTKSFPSKSTLVHYEGRPRPDSPTIADEQSMLGIQEMKVQGMVCDSEHTSIEDFEVSMRLKYVKVATELRSFAESTPNGNILVIDSFGYGDWSYYAAQKWKNCTVSKLCFQPISLKPSQPQESSYLEPPQNHKHLQYAMDEGRFLCSANSFDHIVYLLPVIETTEMHYSFLAECLRSLRDGGSVELVMLDQDLRWPGDIGRRAVRKLKEDLLKSDMNICLAPIADTLIRFLARTAKVCKLRTVEIPVAEDIRSEVAIWLYMKCYSVRPLKNIFSEGRFLAECKKNKTMFKFTVCRATKAM